MATSLGARKAAVRFISYSASTKTLRASLLQIRKFSGCENRDGPNVLFHREHSGPNSISWPDDLMGPLNTPDYRFALPGNVGLVVEHKTEEKTKADTETDCLPSSSIDRHLTIISQLISESDYLDPEGGKETRMADTILRKYFDDAKVELVIQDCPQMINKDFGSLFTDMPRTGKLTVITMTQRTNNDMSGWSLQVEEERDKLLENFITTATEICHMLRVHQHWCDFIDPSTGQPFFGSYTNTSFYETDERYRHLGFDIEDLGCCKVIYHKKWGTKVFIGSIFTMAPKEHQVMKDLLKILQ